MGLGNRQSGNYITILNGKFSQKQDPKKWENVTDVELKSNGIFKRVNKIGNTVFEKYYDKFTGFLKNIKTNEGAYGKSWIFTFKDENEIYHLQLSYSNSFATAFLKMLPNIDVSKVMTLSPSVKEIDGKNKSSLFVNQDGSVIKHAYTMDKPNGLPDMEQVMVKGEKVWDDTKRLQFLEQMILDDIMPKLARLEENKEENEKSKFEELTDSSNETEQKDKDQEPF